MNHIAFVGGQIALDLVSNSSPYLKSDRSVSTKADIAISKLAHSVIGDWLTTSDHLLIDEEDAHNVESLDQSYLTNTPFIWALDPIDGTRSFSNGMPNFGISIGLLKNLKPWLGVVYFPMLGELFYSDGKQSFFVQNAFTEHEEKRAITPVEQQITKQSIFICNDSFFERFDWHPDICQIMNPACAVLSLCWPAVGRGCGAFFGAHIWDFAGSWPIFLSAGLCLRSYQTGKQVKQLDIGLFAHESKDPWKLNEYYILSSEPNFAILREQIVPKHETQITRLKHSSRLTLK